jgi:hypothetical protein
MALVSVTVLGAPYCCVVVVAVVVAVEVAASRGVDVAVMGGAIVTGADVALVMSEVEVATMIGAERKFAGQTRSHRSCIWGASRFGQSPLSCSFLSSCWRCVRIFLLACGRCSGPYVGNARIPRAARQACRQCRRIRDRCGPSPRSSITQCSLFRPVKSGSGHARRYGSAGVS